MAESAEGSAGEPMAKRPRIEAEDPNSKTMLTALTAAKGVCGVDLKVGLRLQVRWSVIAEEEEGEQAEGKAEGDVAEGEADKSNAQSAAEPASGDGQKEEEGGESSAEGAAENKDKDQEEAAEEEDYVWWGCHLDSLKTDKGPYGPIWVLKYDAMTVKKEHFDAEERLVSFTAKNLLFDLGLVSDVGDDLDKLQALASRVAAADQGDVDDSTEEALADAHDKSIMHFRVEGEDLNPPVLFTAGTFVTVERQGEEARVGLVKQLNPDGTYHVVYGVGDEELSVSSKAVSLNHDAERAAAEELGEALADEQVNESNDVSAFSIEEFINTTVQSLTQGPTFQRLSAEEKRTAADKAAKMKPVLKKELEKLMSEKGRGYIVSGADIAAIFPLVLSQIR